MSAPDDIIHSNVKGGGVRMGETVSTGDRCRILLHKSASLVQLRDAVLLPIMEYYAMKETKPQLTLQNDAVLLVWQIFKQGGFFCELVNQLQPGIISRYTLPIRPLGPNHFDDINSRQNLATVIKACKDMFFMTDDQLFVPGDLYKDDFIAFHKALRLAETLVDNKLRVSMPLLDNGDLIKRASMNLSAATIKLFDMADADGQEVGPVAAADKRGRLLRELLESERVYVSDLAKLYKYSEEIRFERLISPDALLMLFPNLRALLNVQQKFLSALEMAAKDPELMEVGKLFPQFESHFSVYEGFCVNHNQALQIAKDVQESLKKRSDLLGSLGSDLSTFLIKPVQRIPRYQLFLRDMLKESTKLGRSDSCRMLETGMQSVVRVATRLNELQRRSDNEAYARDFFSRFPASKGCNEDQTGRLLLCTGNVSVVFSGSPEARYRLYLFEQFLFVCNETAPSAQSWIREWCCTDKVKFMQSRRPCEIDLIFDPSCGSGPKFLDDKKRDAPLQLSITLKNEGDAKLWIKWLTEATRRK